MATRTPGLQQRSQYHRNWGNYTDGGQTTPANGTLPNQASNALANPEFSKLEAGDIAYVTTTDAGLYYCASPGTLSGGDAVWVMLAAGGAVVQTIRDAHQIVVGQSSAPYSNVAGQDADVLDPGDGTGIETALANASALIVGGYLGCDVRVRPCNIIMDPSALGAVPIVVPANVRFLGAGKDISSITGGDGTGGLSQAMFSVGQNGSIEDFELISPAPAAAPAASAVGLVELKVNALARRLQMSLARNPAFARNGGTSALYSTSSGASGVVVDECNFALDDLLPDVQASIAVNLNGIGDASDREPMVRNCTMEGGNNFALFTDVDGGIIQNCQHNNAICPNADLSFVYATLPTPAVMRGPRIDGYRLSMTADDSGDKVGIAVFVTQSGSPVAGIEMSNIKIQFLGNIQPLNNRDAIFIGCNGAAGSAQIEEVGLANINVISEAPPVTPENVIHIQVLSGNVDTITGLSITNLQTNGAENDGVNLDTAQNSLISYASVANSKLRNCGNTAVNITGGCVDCIVLGNNFAGSFAGVTDIGTGTESAHNIN